MDDPILVVSVRQGHLRGIVSKNIDGEDFYSFSGIPYARPPIGELRFKAPLPPLSWKGVLDATKNGNCCYSKNLFTKKFIGSEDCLNLNVYTPKLPKAKFDLKPVMVWIHGGGFTCGSNSSEIYGPEFLMTSNVVIVTINYRLGLLGFLSLEDLSLGVHGNAGFKDMVMALKWVNNNIKAFNGDPDNVTIFGESAGGAAVHLLMLSPMAKGLFHKAIAQSGCALNPWSRSRRFDENVFYKMFGVRKTNDEQMLAHLQKLSVEKLLEAQTKIDYYLDPNKIGPFGLVIEKEDAGEAFITQEPLDIILSRKFYDVPFMIGYTKHEGMLVNTYREERIVNMINDFENNIPHFLGYEIGSKESRVLGKKIKNFYYGVQEPNHRNKRIFYDMVTDTLFLYGIYCTVRKHSLLSRSPLYLYRMSIETPLKFLKPLMTQEESGVAHGDDIAYLFKNIHTPPLASETIEYVSVKMFVKLWTNFAYYANPTPYKNEFGLVWQRVQNQQINFLDIDKKLTFYHNLDHKSLKFWDQLFRESPCGYKFT